MDALTEDCGCCQIGPVGGNYVLLRITSGDWRNQRARVSREGPNKVSVLRSVEVHWAIAVWIIIDQV